MSLTDPNELRLLNVEGTPDTEEVRPDLFALAVTSTRMSMVIADPNQADCPIVYCNRAFLDLTGYTEKEVVGRNCRFLQGPETDRDTVRRIRESLDTRRDVHEELLNYRKNGSHFWCALQINAIVDAAGRLRYYFASQRDVTRQREALSRAARSMQSLSSLATGVAHQVNNLLTVVVGSIERAAKRAADDSQATDLQRADWAARRTGELAGALLAMAQPTGQATPVDLNAAINELEGTFTQVAPGRVSIALQFAPVPVVARVDSVLLGAVLLGLLRNATEALPGTGHVAIRTRVVPPVEAERDLGMQDAVELAVVDDGPGMTPEVAKRATEIFFSTKEQSHASGLGLFIAQGFAEQAGGRLLLETDAGRGTTVRLVLPRERG
ncbi:MAG: PAS domain-containing protein [Acetobacteraceae bacterium]|nr:PAS domain-containing protein [Acetobacteraceae bacterium]